MVVLGLFVRADLENVAEFAAPRDHRYALLLLLLRDAGEDAPKAEPPCFPGTGASGD